MAGRRRQLLIRERPIRLSGRAVSRAWANVMVAASDDDHMVALYEAVLVEHYTERGVRLVATDSYMLVQVWVPFIAGEDEPGTDEAPDETVVARDLDGRASNLFKWVRSMTKKEDQPDLDVHVTVRDAGAEDEDAGQQTLPLGADFDGEMMVIATDVEHVALPVWDGAYPTWRVAVVSGDTGGGNVAHLSLSNVARLGKFVGVGVLRFDFTDGRLVHFEAPGDDSMGTPGLAGVVARIRVEAEKPQVES